MTRPSSPRLPRAGSNRREALEVALGRSVGLDRPDGRCDNGGRWYPSDDEAAGCCQSVRGPSRTYPWSQYRHAFAAAHVACHYGIDLADLRRLMTAHRTRIVGPWLPRCDTHARIGLARVGRPDLLAVLAADTDPDVRVVVAARSRSPEVLQALASDRDLAVRAAVLANRACPAHLLALRTMAGRDA